MKPPLLSGNEVVHAFLRAGYIKAGQRGSHIKLFHPDRQITLIIPNHRWDTHSITEFTDELKPIKVEFVKPKKKLVSLRLDTQQIKSLKKIASDKGFGYLTLMRLWITERLSRERRPTHAHR